MKFTIVLALTISSILSSTVMFINGRMDVQPNESHISQTTSEIAEFVAVCTAHRLDKNLQDICITGDVEKWLSLTNK